MPKRFEEYHLSPIVLTVFKEEFKEPDYTLQLNGAFDLTTPVSALQQEAGVKGCVLVMQVALVPAERFYEDEDIEDEDKGVDDEQ